MGTGHKFSRMQIILELSKSNEKLEVIDLLKVLLQQSCTPQCSQPERICWLLQKELHQLQQQLLLAKVVCCTDVLLMQIMCLFMIMYLLYVYTTSRL